MKVVKKVGIALMIVVGILLALFLIFVGYLFVMPAHSLFGYRLANYSKNREITTTASVAGLTTEHCFACGRVSVEFDCYRPRK